MRERNKSLLKAYWVSKGVLMAGEYPASFDGDDTRRRLRWLLERGVNSFIDLTEPGEAGLKHYLNELIEEAERSDVLVKHQRCSIPDMSVPTKYEMRRILDLIKDAAANGDTVYVHCYGGKGRTGTVVGCYLVNQGLTGEAALQRITQLRGDPPDGLIRSPETDEQREMVRNWESAR